MKRIIVLSLFVLLFVSCVSTNNMNTENSLLLLYNENDTNERSNAFVYYQYRGNNFLVKINIMERFQQINHLKAGIYPITKFEAIYLQDDSIAQSYPTPFNIELKKDTVYIFPLKTITKMTPKGQSFDFKPLTDSDYQKCIAYIKSKERYNGLEIAK